MRVELVYAPGCSTYKKALHVLETVIAEEQLPIAIEQVEDGGSAKPRVLIDGVELGSGVSCFESLRKSLSSTWGALTIPA